MALSDGLGRGFMMTTWAEDVFIQGILNGLVLVWPLWLALGGLFLIQLTIGVYRTSRLIRSGIREVDRMDGKTFERFLEALFNGLGYKVERTRYVNDYGADLVVAKGGTKTVVQAKRYKRRVGVGAVQEAVAAKALYGCSEAMVVTNSMYTRQAERLARSNKVRLWNRNRLISALMTSKEARRRAKTRPNTTDSSAPQQLTLAQLPGKTEVGSCARCGTSVSAKVREYCLARPKRFGGRVYCYDHQRTR